MGELIIDTMGLMGIPCLWILGIAAELMNDKERGFSSCCLVSSLILSVFLIDSSILEVGFYFRSW